MIDSTNSEEVMKKFHDTNFEIYNPIYETRWKSASHHYYWFKTKERMLNRIVKACLKLQKENLVRPVKLLDVGCDTGTDLFMYERLLSDWGLAVEFYGLDISKDKIETAKQHVSKLQKGNIEFYQDNAQTLENSQGKFDIITCSEVYEHLPEPEKMVKAISQHLNSTGNFIFSTPSVTRSSALFYKYIYKSLERKSAEYESSIFESGLQETHMVGMGHISEMQVNQVCAILDSSGFSSPVVQRGFITYGGHEWDSKPITFMFALGIDRGLDGVYKLLSKMKWSRGLTFAINGIYDTQLT